MSKIISLNQQRLIRGLGALSPNVVYAIAPKRYVLRGFDYYKKGLLLGFKWSSDFSELQAIVSGSRHYSVIFSMDSHALSYSCDCPAWDPYSNCKHTVCALITIKNLFDSSSFRNVSQDEERRKHLLADLFSANREKDQKSEDAAYSVVFKMNDDDPDIYVCRDGERLAVSYNAEPKELVPLIRPPYHSYVLKQGLAKRYLKEYGNLHPLVLRLDGKDIALTFDDSLEYSCITEFDAYSRYVKVSRLLKKNGQEFSSYLPLEDLIIDMEDKKLGFLKDRSGWKSWNELTGSGYDDYDEFEDDESDDSFGVDFYDNVRSVQHSSSIHIPLREFNKILLIYPSSASTEDLPGHLMLKREGTHVPAEKAVQDYSIAISAYGQGGDQFVLNTGCRVGRSKQTPSYRLFKFFSETNYGLSTPLKAKKRRAMLYRAFFDMISARTKAAGERAIRNALSEGDFSRASIKREARELLKYYLSIFLQSENQLQLHNGAWTVSPVDKVREFLLYKVPYELFGWNIFTGATGHDEMFVPSKDLFEKLPLLHEKCKEHGIELFFKNKQVVSSSWDFSFDASRSTGIDWFEIKPEIKCNGRVVDASLLTEILKGKSMVVERDSVQIMDSNSQQILNAISAMYKTGGISGTDTKKKEVVRVPRLLILDWIELRRSGVNVKLPPEDEKIIERLNRFDKIEERALPEKLKAKLRPYQREGYYWLSFLHEHRFGACLADDMGLGKTVQAITMLGGIREGVVSCPERDRACPHLIVVPPSLLFNWQSEIKKFYPAMKIYQYTGKDRGTAFKGHDIVLTTYALVRRDIKKLRDIRFNTIVFDEAQAVKNIYADTTGAVRQLSAYFKVAMTGTPVENHLGEYYSIIDLVIPGLLGEYDKFRPLLKRDFSPELDTIIKRTKPFVLRRTKEKILKELPLKLESDIYLDLTEKQKALYRKTVEQVRSTIDEAYKDKTSAQAKIIALTAILKLRQLCVSPRLLSGELEDKSPKIDFLINKLQELQDEDHSALVFSQFTSFLDILEEDLRNNKMRYLRLDGSTPTDKRKKLVEEFQSGEGPSIFLLSLKAGGQGLNLTKASYVFHLDPWWNPAVENQASDRAHRIGQRKKVFVTRILTRHTIEEKMMHLKKKKLALYKAVMGDSPGGKKTLSITKADFNFLLG